MLLIPPSQTGQRYLKTTLSAQYFMLFGIMGVFLPYFNLYCYHMHLSGVEIGTINACRSLLILLFSVVWGVLADRYQRRRLFYILCQFICACACSFYLIADTFISILSVTIIASIFYAPLVSFMEAFTMDLIGDSKHDYGTIRLWGSIQFIVMVLLVGELLNHFSYGIIIDIIVVGGGIQALVSFSIPKSKKPKSKKTVPSLQIFKEPQVIVYLISTFLMLVSHGTYYAFSSIHLEQLGAKTNEISIYWALGSIAEIFVMLNSRHIFNRFQVETILIFSFGMATIRWLLMFYTTSVIVALVTQVFHAATYGAYHIAGILYIDRCMPESTKTIGQAVNNAVSYGLGIMTGSFISGYLFETVGTHNSFLFSAVIAAIAGCILGVYCFIQRTEIQAFRERNGYV
ncbi:MAG: MFS transporter [Candidatus Magnetomorum sp.]|nr:MFS transporter [Candidatus Magnetomorum sp.]